MLVRIRGIRVILSPSKILFAGIFALLLLFSGSEILRAKDFPERAESLLTSFDWQKVNGADPHLYVYSAYYLRNPPRVQVIGVTRTLSEAKIQCCLYDRDGIPITVVNGDLRMMKDHWNLNYSACFVTCNLPYMWRIKLGPIPAYVTLTTDTHCASKNNILPVQKPSITNSSSKDFSVCVKPLYNYDRTWQFQEWMEFHLMMGVKHFTFYDISIGPGVKCLLEKVYGSESITILPWTPPTLKFDVEIREESSLAALNDCVYRHRGVSKYLAVLDVDEMIIPREIKANSYSDLIGKLDDNLDTVNVNRQTIGAYTFQSSFFFLQWYSDRDEIKDDLLRLNLSRSWVNHKSAILRNTRRRQFQKPPFRSKYICEPEKIIEAGNHEIWEMEPTFQIYKVPASLAAVHHYRKCDLNQCPRVRPTGDKSAQDFLKGLVPRMTQSLAAFNDRCPNVVVF